MSRQTLILAAVAVVLGILTFWDYSGQGQEPAGSQHETGKSGENFQKRIRRLVDVVDSSQEIQRAYGQIAIPYAEQMAETQTFFTEKIAPKVALNQLLRNVVTEQGAEVQQLQVGEPSLRGEGVFSVSASVKIRTTSHRAAFRVLDALSDFNNGLVWRSFSLQASVKERQIVIAGELLAVIVQAVE